MFLNYNQIKNKTTALYFISLTARYLQLQIQNLEYSTGI